MDVDRIKEARIALYVKCLLVPLNGESNFVLNARSIPAMNLNNFNLKDLIG